MSTNFSGSYTQNFNTLGNSTFGVGAQIVFIDAAVADVETLVAGLPEGTVRKMA